MGKKFKDKKCVYCYTNNSTTADHVFARDNLPKVPACKNCNKEKSGLEHKLTAILPFGGTSISNATEEKLEKRLANNNKLKRELSRSMQKLWQPEKGIIKPVLSLEFDTDLVLRLYRFIVRGLMFYHWKVILKPEHDTRVMFLSDNDKAFFSIFETLRGSFIGKKIGNDAFAYKGKQGTAYPELSIWLLSNFYCLRLSNDDLDTVSQIGAITASKSYLQKFKFSRIFGYTFEEN